MTKGTSMTPINILFLCTGNSARSILAEAILSETGAPRFKGYSAGSDPKETPHPRALERLAAEGWDTTAYASKSWDVFATPDAPEMDIVITICDNAAGETCPFWPGAPVTVHWGLPDPAAEPSESLSAAFDNAFEAISSRIAALIALPLETMTAEARKTALAQIHRNAK